MSISQRQAFNASRMDIGVSSVQEADAKRRDMADFWLRPDYDHLECLHARFKDHRYIPHTHQTFSIGVIQSGAEKFNAGGVSYTAPAGSLVVLNPDVLHDGEPARDGFEYRMLYPSVRLMSEIFAELHRDEPSRDREATGTTPSFGSPVLQSAYFAQRFAKVHKLIGQPGARLTIDVGLVGLLGDFIRLFADVRPLTGSSARNSPLVSRLRERLDASITEDIGLQDLAREEGISRFTLLRSFKRECGVCPNTYRTSRRILRAKGEIKSGLPLSEISASCGFYDQSHFTKTFKSVVGVTPGQYRSAIA